MKNSVRDLTALFAIIAVFMALPLRLFARRAAFHAVRSMVRAVALQVGTALRRPPFTMPPSAAMGGPPKPSS